GTFWDWRALAGTRDVSRRSVGRGRDSRSRPPARNVPAVPLRRTEVAVLEDDSLRKDGAGPPPGACDRVPDRLFLKKGCLSSRRLVDVTSCDAPGRLDAHLFLGVWVAHRVGGSCPGFSIP